MNSRNTSLHLGFVDGKAATYACQHWHYSRSRPANKSTYVGVWEHGKFIGVVIFGQGATKNLLAPYGLKHTEGCELTRVALRTHNAPVSRIVAIAIKLLKKHSPSLRLIISFADPMEGHVGGIYQAMNWIYNGQSNAATKYMQPDGRIVHRRTLSKTGWVMNYGKKVKTYRFEECKEIFTEPKHRYLYPLDKEMRKQIIKLAKPYPKCAGSIVSDAPGHQPGEGGADPTPALQSDENQ